MNLRILWLLIFLIISNSGSHASELDKNYTFIKQFLNSNLDNLSNMPRVDSGCNEISNNTLEKISNFCRNPYDFICSNLQTHRKTQFDIIDKIRKKNPELNADDYYVRTKNLQPFFKKSLPLFDKDALINELKSNLELAIESSSLSTNIKEKFKLEISSVEIVIAKDFSDQLMKDHKAGKEISSQDRALDMNILSACSTDFLTPVAFAEDTVQGKRNTFKKRIVLCNGSLLSSKDIIDRNLMVLLHELAHFISPTYEEKIYEAYTACFTSTNGKSLLKDYERSGETLANSGYDRTKWESVIVNREMVEAMSDIWASEALAKYHKNKGSTPEEILESLQKSYGYFCGTTNGGSHPSGKFRIGIMGNNPETRKLLGCKEEIEADSKIVTCNLQ